MVEFCFENVPTGSGIANHSTTFAVKDRVAIEKWKKDEEKEKRDHGDQSGGRINYYKKAFY